MRRFLVLVGVFVAVLSTVASTGRFGREILNQPYWKILANFTGVYIHIPRDCGVLGCIGPDLRLLPWWRVTGADPSTFEYVGRTTEEGTLGNTSHYLFRDVHTVYIGLSNYGTFRVEGSDPASLELHNGYAVDGRYVYMDGTVFRNLDPATFEKLGCHLWRDLAAVYCGFTGLYEPIPGVDAATFEVISKGRCTEDSPLRARDKNGEYTLDIIHGFKRVSPGD